MAVGIVLPIFALGASALGMAAEWGAHGPLVKGLLSVAGGVGSNGLFDWLKQRWFTRPPGTRDLMENHHLAGLLGTALGRAFELAAEEARQGGGDLALHAPRIKALAGAAAARWLEIVDDERTPQFDPLRGGELTDVVTAVCENDGAAPLLEIEDWEPLVRAVDKLEGSPTLSMAAVAHTARVLRNRTGRIFYELVKDARDSNPEAYAALQLHFFADLKAAAASQSEQLAAIREQLDALGAAIEDGAGRTVSRRGKPFNWQRLTSLLRPMRDMAAAWEKFYARHDQRWDAMLAKLDAIPEETTARLWERLLPHLRKLWVAVPLGIALIAGVAWAVYEMGRKLDTSAARESEMASQISDLQRRLDELLPVAGAIRAQNERESRTGEAGAARSSGALAEAAAQRRQTPEELRAELAATAAEAARLATEAAKTPGGSRDTERDYWRKAGDLALAADAVADAERYYRSALALAPKGGALWCEIAGSLAVTLNEQARLAEEEALLREVAAARGALGEPQGIVEAAVAHSRALTTLGRFEEAEAAAEKGTALEDAVMALDPKTRASCLADILLLHTTHGHLRDTLRLSEVLMKQDFGSDENGRFNNAITQLAAAFMALFVDEPGRAMTVIETAAAEKFSSPLLNSTFAEKIISSLLARYPKPPRPPRAEQLLRRMSASVGPLVEADFKACGSLLFEKAALLRADGLFADELALVRRGLELAKQNFPEGHAQTGLWQCELARALTLPEEAAEAEALWKSGLATIAKHWGPGSSTLLSLRTDYALFLDYHGRHSEAEEVQRDVLARLTSVLGPVAPRVIHAKFDLLPLLHALKRHDEVRRLRAEIFTFLRDHPRPGRQEISPLLNRYMREPLSEAEFSALRDAITRHAQREEARGAGSHGRITLQSLLVELHFMARDKAGALAAAEQAVRVGESAFGPDTMPVAMLLRALSGTHVRAGDYRSAESPLLAALKIAEARTGVDSVTVAQFLDELSQLLVDLRRRPDAITVLRRALKILDARPDDDPLLHYGVMARLGALLADDGDKVEGERLLRQSISEQEKRTGFDAETMEQRSIWLARLLGSTGRTREAEDVLLRVLSGPYKLDDGSPAYRVCDAFFEYMRLLLATRREREVEKRLRRYLSPLDGRPASGPYVGDASSLYMQSLAALGMGEIDARNRRESVLRGDPVKEL